MNIFLIIGILIATIVLGLFIGKFIANLKTKYYEKKLIKNAKMVISGEMKNQTVDFNGKLVDVDKFKVKADDGTETSISLTGEEIKIEKESEKEGKKKKNGKK
jgi:hypothetical protein